MAIMFTEDKIVDIVCDWLRSKEWIIESYRHGTAQGDDIHATKNKIDLFVECKGEISKNGKQLNHWLGAAGATFNAIRDVEHFRKHQLHGIAIPKTQKYQNLLGVLRAFFNRGRIVVFWVNDVDDIEAWWPDEGYHV